jgi:5'-nucleotidase
MGAAEVASMHILVTNDDGVTAPGLAVMAQALLDVGRVSVIAPDRNWSASGHVKTMHKPLRATPAHVIDGVTAFSTNGAPSDCVALALLGLLDVPVELVVSGINPNANVGHDVTYSGTVTSAMEAAISGVPGIAVSVNGAETHGYAAAAEIATRIVRAVIEHGLPPHTLLNVNVPARPAAEMQGVRITRMGMRAYQDHLVTRTDPAGRPYYWIGGARADEPLEPGTDITALAEGYVSVTPLSLDLTADSALAVLEGWSL